MPNRTAHCGFTTTLCTTNAVYAVTKQLKKLSDNGAPNQNRTDVYSFANCRLGHSAIGAYLVAPL